MQFHVCKDELHDSGRHMLLLLFPSKSLIIERRMCMDVE